MKFKTKDLKKCASLASQLTQPKFHALLEKEESVSLAQILGCFVVNGIFHKESDTLQQIIRSAGLQKSSLVDFFKNNIALYLSNRDLLDAYLTQLRNYENNKPLNQLPNGTDSLLHQIIETSPLLFKKFFETIKQNDPILNEKNSIGQTPLVHLIKQYSDNTHAMSYTSKLINLGANIEELVDNKTLLEYILFLDLSKKQYFLDKVILSVNKDLLTTMMCHVNLENRTPLEVCLDNGGQDALLHAAQLITWGAKPAKSNSGQTWLQLYLQLDQPKEEVLRTLRTLRTLGTLRTQYYLFDDVKTLNNQGDTALQWLLFESNKPSSFIIHVGFALIQAKSQVKTVNKQGQFYTWMHFLIEKGTPDELKNFLNRKQLETIQHHFLEDLLETSNEQGTPYKLLLDSELAQEEIWKYGIELIYVSSNHEMMDIKNIKGYTLMHYLMILGEKQPKIRQNLASQLWSILYLPEEKKKYLINQMENALSYVLIHYPSGVDKINIAYMLIRAGANPLFRDENGNTWLHLLAESHDIPYHYKYFFGSSKYSVSNLPLDVIKLLMDAKNDSNETPIQGVFTHTNLHYKPLLSFMLIKYGSEPSTWLHWLLFQSMASVNYIKSFLREHNLPNDDFVRVHVFQLSEEQRKQVINAPNAQGQTPLQALWCDKKIKLKVKKELGDLLVKAGADPMVKNADGITFSVGTANMVSRVATTFYSNTNAGKSETVYDNESLDQSFYPL